MAEIEFPRLVDIAIVEVKVIPLEEGAAIIARISDLWDEATHIYRVKYKLLKHFSLWCLYFYN